MGKISIVSRRRREERFPETAAQRRARVREGNRSADRQPVSPLDQGDAMPSILLIDLPEGGDTDGVSPCDAWGKAATVHGAIPPSDTSVYLRLSPDQSETLAVLPSLAEQQRQPLTFALTEQHDQRGIVLQFSLHAETIPTLLSLQELCQQLKVGRRAILRLVRTGQLHPYRIGKRYRFAVSEVKYYLTQNLSATL